LPLASVAVQLTVVIPFGNVEPDGGLQLAVADGQLSLAEAEKVMAAEQRFGSVALAILEVQMTVGLWVSLTVTANEQETLLPLESVAEQVTVVTPLGKVDPDEGEQVTAPTPGQLSLTLGVAKVTTAEH
jgi:hypothetical protein